MAHTHSGLAKPKLSSFRTRRETYGTHSVWFGETPALHSQNEMRTLWRTLILGWRNLGFAFSERDANPMVQIHFGKAKPRLCIPRTRYEPRGAHSLWVGETYVAHAPNERQTPWRTPSLGWRYLSFAFPERDTVWCTLILGWPYLGCALPRRDANHMVHTHSRLPKPRFRIPRTRCELDAAHSCQVGET